VSRPVAWRTRQAEQAVIGSASWFIENCPAGLLSTRDALDDGNAYGSAEGALRGEV